MHLVTAGESRAADKIDEIFERVAAKAPDGEGTSAQIIDFMVRPERFELPTFLARRQGARYLSFQQLCERLY